MSIFDQLAQQPCLESAAPEHIPFGILDLLSKSADKLQSKPLLGFIPEFEQQQSYDLLSLMAKGD